MVTVTVPLPIIDNGELFATRTRRGLWNPWLSTLSCGLGKNEIDTAAPVSTRTLASRPIAIRTACLWVEYKLQLRGNRTYPDCGHNIWRSVRMRGSSHSVSDLGDIGIGVQPFYPGTSLVVEVVAVATLMVGVVLVVATLVVGEVLAVATLVAVVLVVATLVVGVVVVWVLATFVVGERGSGVLSAPLVRLRTSHASVHHGLIWGEGWQNCDVDGCRLSQPTGVRRSPLCVFRWERLLLPDERAPGRRSAGTLPVAGVWKRNHRKGLQLAQLLQNPSLLPRMWLLFIKLRIIAKIGALLTTYFFPNVASISSFNVIDQSRQWVHGS